MMGNALLLDLSIGSTVASNQIIMKLSGLPIAWHHMMMMIGFCICLIVFHQKDMPIGGSLIECERPGFFDTPAGLSKLQGFSMRTRLPIMRSCWSLCQSADSCLPGQERKSIPVLVNDWVERNITFFLVTVPVLQSNPTAVNMPLTWDRDHLPSFRLHELRGNW